MKHVPQRTCVACRQIKPKRELIRIVRTPDGSIRVDETGKANGRGVYLCRKRACWEKALGNMRRAGGLLAASLKAALPESERITLADYAQQLPDDDTQSKTSNGGGG
jgi:uncharacterized protein